LLQNRIIRREPPEIQPFSAAIMLFPLVDMALQPIQSWSSIQKYSSEELAGVSKMGKKLALKRKSFPFERRLLPNSAKFSILSPR
jgi:hypothetical protein